MNLYTLQDTVFCEEATRTGHITPGQRAGGETNKAKGVIGEVVDDRDTADTEWAVFSE